MKFSKILCYSFLLIYCNILSAAVLKKKKIPTPEIFNYKVALKKVDSLLDQVDQPKAAQEALNMIRQKANAEKQNGYYIRCIQYQYIINTRTKEEDDTLNANWQLINAEIAKGSSDIKAFISIDAAAYLKDVYEENRWKNDRISDDNSADPNNWSIEKLNRTLNSCIDDALKFSENLPYNNIYEPVITHFMGYDFALNIQQILTRNAINILNDLGVNTNADYKRPEITNALAPFNEFSIKDFTNIDDPKNEYKRLLLYQRLLNSINNSDIPDKISALIYFDIERLNTLMNNYGDPEKACLKAFEFLCTTYSANPYSNLSAARIADFYKINDPAKAIAIINEALKRHPGFKNEKALLNIKKSIEDPVLAIIPETINQPGRKLLAKVDYTNLSKVYVTAFKVDKIDYLKQTAYEYNVTKKGIFQYLKEQKAFSKTYSLTLPEFKDYKSHSAEVALDSLPIGTYIILVSSSDDLADSVSAAAYGVVSFAPYTVVDSENDLYLLNAFNGLPVPNEPFKVYADNYYMTGKVRYEKIYEGRTNGAGLIELSAIAKDNSNVTIEIGNKLLYHGHYLRNSYGSGNSDPVTFKTITDRSIYRPGQTVYFKCIVYDLKNKRTISGQKIEVVLKDNNGEEKGKLLLATNTYGSASGSFVLPKSGFNSGDFNLSVNENYNVSFKVEEYKRPKYSAKFLAPEKAYKLNDEVSIVGEAKAFAGYAVQEAKVEYTINRALKPKYFYFWGRDRRGSSKTITTGKTVTDKDGKFSVSFKALPDENEDSKTNPYFIFEINATITDLNGEVRTCQYSLNMAYTDRQISISGAEDNALGKPLTLNYSCTNIQDKPLAFTGSITIEKLLENANVIRQRFWGDVDTTAISQNDFSAWFPSYEYRHKKEETKAVLTRSFSNDIKTSLVLSPADLKEAGTYRATIKTLDSRGETLTSIYQFKLAPNTAGPYELNTALNIKCINGSSFEPGSKAKLLISSGAKNARILLTVKSNRGTILEKEILLNRASQIIEIPVIAADRGNIQVWAYVVSDYRIYTAHEAINVPYSNKELNLKLSSFRDETEPGAKEKWIVKLKGPASEKAAMESVAVIYDQSLDDIYNNADWSMRIFDNYYQYPNISSSFESTYFNPYSENNYNDWEDGFYEFYFPEYNSMGIDRRVYGYGDGLGYGEGEMVMDADDDGVYDRIILRKGSFKSLRAISEIGDVNIEKQPSIPITPPRKNFNETAFFYPHLYANSKGEISLEFTMPDALTQWKLRMMAHSTTMQTGNLEHSITTSKKVMVQPNMPRFLRQGDAITLVSKIVNTTTKSISAKCTITLTDEATGQPLKWLTNNTDKMISVPANGSSPVSFSIKIPDYTGVVTIAVTATAGTFSDGEQHTLPVLSNRTLITESMPITIRKEGTQNLEFNGLKNNKSATLVHEKLSVEMSSNPAWYAIQALPYMMEFPHECAEQTFTRLYANSIATHLANKDPEIKKVYAAWERQVAAGNGLQSKLQQNQDLKYTLIEETPWLFEAKNESERMRKLGALFNQEKMKEEQQAAFEKLKQLQYENGAFGWFKGMQANSYITQTIVIGFGKMQRMGIDISPYQYMIDKAIVYLDEEAKRDYNYYHQHKNLNNFYPTNLQYLYCKSYFPHSGSGINDSIVQYFVSNAEKNWVHNGLLNRAQLATAIKVLRPASIAPDLILQSFVENAKQTDEMGMYWSANKSGYYWYDAPVETQAAIIEAFALIYKDKNFIKEQQIWLLRQKQTQNWSTTRSTADACYALLMNGNFINNKQQVSVSVNKVPVKPEKTEEGTGYYRQDLPKESISSSSANIQVTAATSDFAYGAIYWQYFEQMDKLQNTGEGLSITKKIYKVINTATGKQKEEVLTGDLKVGDIIEISLSISSDRNLEFVHIKDLRGAGTEPMDVLSEYHWQNGIGYYQSTKDVATHFFIDNLPKGIYQLNYILKIEQAGSFNSGMATAQCMYAPEYVANSKGVMLKVGE